MSTLTKTATGFVAQDTLMTYATPGIELFEKGSPNWTLAARRGGLDWEPTSRPVFDVLTSKNLPGIRATWNGETFLGVVTDVHQLIPHHRAGGMGDVVKAIVGMYPDSSITALVQLDGGKRIGARITHEEFFLPGDESPIQKETWVWLRHDAKGSLAVIENAQRMFCTNQLGSYSGAASELFVRHTGDTEAKVADLVEKLTARRDDWKLWEEEMAVLQATPVRNGQFDWFTKVYIPEPVPPVSNTRALSAQGDLYAQWAKYSVELGPNAYAGFQAIVEFEDKVRASRGAVSRFQRAIQPNPNKQRGLRMLMEVAR